MNSSIHQFATSSNIKEKKIASQKIIDFRQFGRCEQTGVLPKFQFLTEENHQNILNLKDKHAFFVKLLESLGGRIYQKNEEEASFYNFHWGFLEERGFFKSYFLSKYPIDFLIEKMKN